MSPCAAVRSAGGALVMTTVFTVTEFYKQLVLVFSIIVNAWVHLWIILKYFMLLRFTGTYSIDLI